MSVPNTGFFDKEGLSTHSFVTACSTAETALKQLKDVMRKVSKPEVLEASDQLAAVISQLESAAPSVAPQDAGLESAAELPYASEQAYIR